MSTEFVSTVLVMISDDEGTEHKALQSSGHMRAPCQVRGGGRVGG